MMDVGYCVYTFILGVTFLPQNTHRAKREAIRQEQHKRRKRLKTAAAAGRQGLGCVLFVLLGLFCDMAWHERCDKLTD